jgi:acyl-CoA-binding protein
MKLFELIPEKISDYLPPLLNQEVPPPIDQIAEQVIEAGKIASFASIGLAVKTKNIAKDTLNELVALGEEALGQEKPAANEEEPEVQEAEIEVKPAEPTLDELFDKASIDVKTLNSKPDNATLGELYALYKQATEGDASGKRPGITKVAERFKFDAWNRKKGMTQDNAKEAYISKVERLLSA